MTARRIVFVIFDGLQPIDLVGPHEVFSYAGLLSPDGEYQCQVAGNSCRSRREDTPLRLLTGREMVTVRGKFTSHAGRRCDRRESPPCRAERKSTR